MRLGLVRYAWVWPIAALQGQADLSTEGFGSLCWVLRNSDLAESVRVRLGAVRRGWVWSGEAWHGNRCRRQHWGLWLPLLLSLEGRLGSASIGLIRWGRSRQCPARQKLQTAARSFFGGSLLLSFESRCAPAWHGLIRHGWVCCGAAACNKDCRRQYGGFALPTVLSGTGMVWSGQQRPARVRSGEAMHA